MTSSVIYYSTDARKNEIYLLNNDGHFWRQSIPKDYTINKILVATTDRGQWQTRRKKDKMICVHKNWP